MMIRASGVDRYLFETYLAASRTAQEWVLEAQTRAEWGAQRPWRSGSAQS